MISRIRLNLVKKDGTSQILESETPLRVGRLESLDVCLNDSAISRQHAEVRPEGPGWLVYDLDSTNGTYVNGVRLGPEGYKLQAGDRIRCACFHFVVESVGEQHQDAEASDPVQVEAVASTPWETALWALVHDTQRQPRPGQQLLALLRAGHHLGHLDNEEELLHAILTDAVGALDAQRGAIVLTEDGLGEFRVWAKVNKAGEAPGRFPFSRRLARQAFQKGESILYSQLNGHAGLGKGTSVHDGDMACALCVLLRTPRQRLGILHLDRNHRQPPFTVDDLHLADALGLSISAGIEGAQLWRQQRQLFLNTINVLAQATELRDHYFGGHAGRVTRYALLLGRQLGLTDNELDLIRIGTPLHDIGKIGIDDAILSKPGPLTDEEMAAIRAHPLKGSLILQCAPDLVPAIPIVRSHNERWDGLGYPDGLAGEAIPHLARVVAIPHVFDAMTSDRPYRKALSPEAAFVELKRQSGRQFDPAYLAAFLGMRERILHEMRSRNPTRLGQTPLANEATLYLRVIPTEGGAQV